MNSENYIFYIFSLRKRYNIEKKIYKINIFKTFKIVLKQKLNYIISNIACIDIYYITLHYQFNVI